MAKLRWIDLSRQYVDFFDTSLGKRLIADARPGKSCNRMENV